MATRWHDVWRAYRLLIVAAVVAVLGVAVIAIVASRDDEKPAPDPRARQYLDFTACLLTDDKGIGGTVAAPVWSGMQDASGRTRAKVQYISVAGEQTPENAGTFLNSLAQGRCSVILAVGAGPVAAVAPAAKRFPKSSFVVVGGAATAANITRISAAESKTVHSAVRDLIVERVGKLTSD